MNLRHFHRSNTEEYQRELQELFPRDAYGKFYKDYTPREIDLLVEKDPYAAAKHFKDHPLLNKEHVDAIVQNDPAAAAEHLHKHPLFNENHIDNIIENHPSLAAHYLKKHPLLKELHIDKMVEKDPAAVVRDLHDHPLLNEKHINTIVQKNPALAAMYLKDHPLFNENHVNYIVKNNPIAAAEWLPHLNAEQIQYIIDKAPVTAIANLAPLFNQQQMDHFARHYPELAEEYFEDDPYYYSKYMKLNFSNNTEMLRKLRDSIQEKGGIVNAKDLPKLGFNENSLKINHLKDAKGNYTDTAIQQHIDNQPKHTYDISHTTWDGGQSHSDEPQSVFQLNYTGEMKKQLKAAGVLNTFNAVHEASFNSHHPVKENTLGWVRYTKGEDGHIHIDEVQSDLGRNLHNTAESQIEEAEREGRPLSQGQKKRIQELFSKEKLNKMNDILFKGHHPSKLLHEAFLQHLRNTGHVGKDIHIWQAMPKAELADQTTYMTLHLDDFLRIHNKVQNNQTSDLFDNSIDGLDATRRTAKRLIGDVDESRLFKKHLGHLPPNEINLNLPENSDHKQNYINDVVNSKRYKIAFNYLKSRQTGDTLDSALEHPEIKDEDGVVNVPYTVNDLPVHMKIGYHEAPIKMGYKADTYGKIDTQESDELFDQPTWKQPLRKSLKALTAEYEYLQKQLNSAKNMTKSIAGDSHEKSTNESRRNEEVGSGLRLGKIDRGSRANMARPGAAISFGRRQENAGKPTTQRPRSAERFMGKSEALAGEFKKLLKAVLKYGVWVPDHVDAAHKKQHPEKKRYVGHYGKNGEPTWTYDSAQSNLYDNNLKMLLNNQQITKDGKTYLPNKLNTLTKENIDLLSDYVTNNLMKDPDRHVIAANTDPSKPKDHMEVRVRHLINALTGSEGYEIKDVPTGGFEIYAPRHSQSVKTKDIATRWTFHPTKKRFKSERIYPISDEGGKTDGSPTGQSQYGRDGNRRLGKADRGSRANESGQSKPSHHDVGKSLSMDEVTEKNSRLLKAEDEAGMTAYSLKDGYSLHHETSQNGYDIWAIGHGGQRAGTFMICTDKNRRGRPFVSWAGVDKPHRGKGIGAAVYKTLAVHYGGLDSDRNSTSTDATKAWRRAGGKQLKIKTQFGDFRYTLEGDKKKPPVMWNEELKKEDSASYRGSHKAPTSDTGYGTPIHNLKDTYPDDIYSSNGARFYGAAVPHDAKAINVLRFARNNPYAKVKIYRAVPKIQSTPKIGINRGDWVTTTKEYARIHGELVHGKGNYVIVSKTVPAHHVWTDGNSIHEYGYDPTPKDFLKKTRGTLTFPKVLPKDTRPEENVKQVNTKAGKKEYLQYITQNEPKWTRWFAKIKQAKEIKSGGGIHNPDVKNPRSFAFSPEYHVKAHEGIHAIVTNIANHFGTHTDNIYNHLNNFIHENDKKALSYTLDAAGYDHDEMHQEYVPWIHTILHNKLERNQFLDEHYPITHENEPISWHDMIPEAAGEENQPNVKAGRQAIQRLGRTWKAIQSFGKQATAPSEEEFAGQALTAASKYRTKKS